MVTSVVDTTAAASNLGSSKSTVIGSDFDTFLKLLTTQMQNQDPLNPIDSTDYATQLATFSGVEQQTRTNQLLESLGGQMSLMGMSQLAAWVGQEARTDAAVWMDGDPVTVQAETRAGADRAVLVVKDAQGKVVARDEIDPAGGEFQWIGTDVTGAALPDGVYILSVESWRDETVLGSDPVQSYGRILEARNGTTGTTLVLEGGIEVASDRISALRVPF
ncbi:flagellar hook capping FlgD N-terminal domain-containing protein [Paracoccaceae bacterium]